MAIYLLVKEHVDTGLKYLCKRVASSFSECEKYKGSGVYWTKHLKKYGNNVKTTCLFVTENKDEFYKVAKKYSLDYNVTKSKEWANLTGAKNNNAKGIETPFGFFGSISEASRQLKGYTYRMIWYKLHNDIEWRYLKSL